MTEIKKIIFFFVTGSLILTLLSFAEKENIFFHKIRYTASSVVLEEWNTKDTINNPFVKEFVDNKGRTKELRFYNYNHELAWAGSGFWGGPIIRYDYLDNQIIETFFSSDNEIANDFKTSEVPYRHIYFLNDHKEIIDSKLIYKMNFEWTMKSLEETIKHLNFYKDYAQEGTELDGVFGYGFAYAKMNGINPQLKK